MSFSCIMLLPCIIEFSDVLCLNDKMQDLRAETEEEKNFSAKYLFPMTQVSLPQKSVSKKH